MMSEFCCMRSCWDLMKAAMVGSSGEMTGVGSEGGGGYGGGGGKRTATSAACMRADTGRGSGGWRERERGGDGGDDVGRGRDDGRGWGLVRDAAALDARMETARLRLDSLRLSCACVRAGVDGSRGGDGAGVDGSWLGGLGCDEGRTMSSIAATLASNFVLARDSSCVAAVERCLSSVRASSRAAMRSRRFTSVRVEGASEVGEGCRIAGGRGSSDGVRGDGWGMDGGGGG